MSRAESRGLRAPDPRLAAGLLAALTLASFSAALGFGFSPVDDADYVTGNPWVQHGFSRAQLRWALTSRQAANWHPLTWLSHTLDWSLFGDAAGGHHLTSLLLHTATALLLLRFFWLSTQRPWPSLAAAALFAVHPLRVESVVWISERKDVLSGLCFALLLLAWRRYAERPSLPRYGLSLLLLALGLSAKAMLVTAPVVLLLLDRWPLGRKEPWARLALEKAPLLCLSAASSAITLLSQREGGAVWSVEVLPLHQRAANALLAAVRYLGMTAAPRDLAIHYPLSNAPFAERWPALVAAALLLAGLLALGVWQRRARPQILVGTLWMLVMLLPVIGLVQVGGQAVADRYTYLPLIGPVAALVFSLPWEGPRGLWVLSQVACWCAVAALVALCERQVQVWRTGRSLLEHARSISPDDLLLEAGLAGQLLAEGRLDEAEAAYRAVLARSPNANRPLAALGAILLRRHRPAEALPLLQQAVAQEPEVTLCAPLLGQTLTQLGRAPEAVALLGPLAERQPGYPLLRRELGIALAVGGRAREAQAHLEAALALAPDDPTTEINLGILFAQTGRLQQAAEHLERALALDPGLDAARVPLTRVREDLRRQDPANVPPAAVR